MDTVKVAREGGRGWHNIAKASFNPAIHKLFDSKPVEPKKKGKKHDE